VESSEQDTCNWIEKCHTKEMKCQEMQRELEQLRATIEEQTADITANKETARNYAKEFAKLKKDVQDSRECQRVIVQERREVAKERDDAKKELKRMRDENQQLMWCVD
jgi:methyl-accepting chemotaxis protein